MKPVLPSKTSALRRHFVNTKIATLIAFFFVLLSFAIFSSTILRPIIPKDNFISFYAAFIIILCYAYLKKVH
ncbi:hypothetical protein HY989_05640 [Candidatus Micrarchaeota archaeon]|nr:hypothetical protein [Candidatus Micrarchaeota archaeon]